MNAPVRIIFSTSLLFSVYLILECTLIEFNVWKRKKIPSSTFLNYSNSILYKCEEKISKKSSTEILEEKVNINLQEINKKVNKLSNKVLKKETIKLYCKSHDIQFLLDDYKKDLFENLDVKNFIDFIFKGSNLRNSMKLNDIEINNLIAIFILLKNKEKIEPKNNTKYYRLFKKFFNLTCSERSFTGNLSKNKLRLINHNTEKAILSRIANM